VLTEHLVDIGLMQGDPHEAVAEGAHALFFPHGLGHMLGLDTHEMENLGEDVVGYAPDQTRSEQFGLHTLRLARPLEPGFVVTVEPGCYFIPELIRQWRGEERHSAFINYDLISDFMGFGGIRIEDDVLVTADGGRVLGPGIPKSVDEVESRAGNAGDA
jgi:Xaa-Pro aminopeptidase